MLNVCGRTLVPLLSAALVLVARQPAQAVVRDVSPSNYRGDDAAYEPPRQSFRMTISGGADTVRTAAATGSYVYRDGSDEYPLQLDIGSGFIAGSVRLEGRIPLIPLGSLQLSPGFALAGAFGGMTAGKGLIGLRLEPRDHGKIGIFGEVFGGVAVLSSPLGKVPFGNNTGASFLNAPDGSTVAVGEQIDITGVSGGVEVGVGILLPFTEGFGVEVRAGLNLWSPVTQWKATAQGTPAGRNPDSSNRTTVELGTFNDVAQA